MSRSRVACSTWCMLTLAAAGVGAAPSASPPDHAAADSLFAVGEFAAADSLERRNLEVAPSFAPSLRRRGAIALFGNRLQDARRWLTRALELDPGDSTARRMLAESWVRGDDFAHAAPLLRALGRASLAAKLESFGDHVPYRVRGDSTSVPFVQTDPLPVLEARVNGGEPIFLILDTGGGELILDSTFAANAGLSRFGRDSGVFGGGRRAGYEHGRIDSLRLGSLTLLDLPVTLQDTRIFAAAGGGRRIDGVLGTVVLYHFLATIDYPGGALVLRPRSPAASAALRATAARESLITVPFWMSGDHFMVARGTLEQSPPLLWFVDTGLAGAAFTCPENTLREAGIEPPADTGGEGIGGGGRMRIAPFAIKRLTLGGAEVRGLMGFLGPFPPQLERGQGYRIAGLISHAFLRSFGVTFDFDAMRIYLKPRRSP